MKRLLFNLSVSLVLSLIAACAVVLAQSNDSHTPLTNAAIVKLVKAGFKDKSIITIISVATCRV
jgi:acyl-CoA reductase-like NAD-dependent aldehyde dehydrogenase